MVIASDNFHQLRAAVWAEREGLTPYAAGAPAVVPHRRVLGAGDGGAAVHGGHRRLTARQSCQFLRTRKMHLHFQIFMIK